MPFTFTDEERGRSNVMLKRDAKDWWSRIRLIPEPRLRCKAASIAWWDYISYQAQQDATITETVDSYRTLVGDTKLQKSAVEDALVVLGYSRRVAHVRAYFVPTLVRELHRNRRKARTP